MNQIPHKKEKKKEKKRTHTERSAEGIKHELFLKKEKEGEKKGGMNR